MKIKVMLSGRTYTYRIDAEVAAGDEVMVPPPFWDPHGPPQRAPVAEVGSDYDGPLVSAWLPPAQERAPAGNGVDQALLDQQRDGAADGAGSQPGLLGDLGQRRED